MKITPGAAVERTREHCVFGMIMITPVQRVWPACADAKHRTTNKERCVSEIE